MKRIATDELARELKEETGVEMSITDLRKLLVSERKIIMRHLKNGNQVAGRNFGTLYSKPISKNGKFYNIKTNRMEENVPYKKIYFKASKGWWKDDN